MFHSPFLSDNSWLFLQSGVNQSYSIGLVIACLLVLVSLWLPDVWKAGK